MATLFVRARWRLTRRNNLCGPKPCLLEGHFFKNILQLRINFHENRWRFNKIGGETFIDSTNSLYFIISPMS